MARLVALAGSQPVDPGERLVVDRLRCRLPDTYTLIPNAESAGRRRQPFECDLIVVSPDAVYVVAGQPGRALAAVRV